MRQVFNATQQIREIVKRNEEEGLRKGGGVT